MCHFISWIDLNKKIYFLDDLKLNTKDGRKLLGVEYRDDILGHGAIRHYYPELKSKGKDYECDDFSSPDNFPIEIVEAVKKGLFRGFSVAPSILTKPARAEYEKIEKPARAEYQAIEKSARAEYQAIEKSAMAEYGKIKKSAWAEYQAIEKSARAEYGKIKKSAWAEYQAIEKSAWAEYQAIEKSALAEYGKIKKSAWAEYEETRQSSFWDIAVQKKNRAKNWK